MITLQNITIRRGPNILIENLSWTIYHKQRIGVIGENGCGKSTLFAILLNQLQADKGDVDIPKHIRLAHVAQETPAYSATAIEYVLDGDVELRELEKALVDAEEKDDGHRIATLHQRLSEIDAYTANARAAQLLDGLGFSYEEQLKSVSDFSGGWRVRLNLAKALMCRSDMLLLDEPTNHLDLDAVLWLEQWLKKYSGTLLLISHDRDFLDEVVDHIVHIHHKQFKLYSGNYSTFERQRAADLLLQQAAFDKQQKKVEHLESFINRFKAKASKAKQAQSRVKALEKMELISAVQAESPFQFHFREPSQCPNPLIYLEDASIAYGPKIVLSHLNFSVSPKDRIALLGPNGAGKTSFIKLLATELSPSTGTYQAGSGLKIGYFAQHQVDTLDLDESPLQHMRDIAPNIRDQELRSYLGSFAFVGNRVMEKVSNFSGGEKSRLALAILIWQKPNLLLLDEPTNHLDLEMRQALSMALQEYEGAMILVSHDRYLVRATVDQLALVAQGQMKNFDGDLDDYSKWLLDFRRQIDKQNSPSIEKSGLSKKEQRKQNAQNRQSSRPIVQQIKTLENELARLEKAATDVEIILADNSLYDERNKDVLQKHLAKQAEIKKQMEDVERKWLAAGEELDKQNSAG
jgi:ATP-binding cassette subfamily F protein 3